MLNHPLLSVYHMILLFGIALFYWVLPLTFFPSDGKILPPLIILLLFVSLMVMYHWWYTPSETIREMTIVSPRPLWNVSSIENGRDGGRQGVDRDPWSDGVMTHCRWSCLRSPPVPKNREDEGRPSGRRFCHGPYVVDESFTYVGSENLVHQLQSRLRGLFFSRDFLLFIINEMSLQNDFPNKETRFTRRFTRRGRVPPSSLRGGDESSTPLPPCHWTSLNVSVRL